MNTENQDTLQKFGKDFQIKCLTSILEDRRFTERIFDILLPEYFETNAQQWVIEKVKEYYVQYRDIPSATVFAIDAQKIEHPLLKQSVVDLVPSLYEHFADKDLKWVKDQFLTFCRNQAMAKAILKSVDLLKNGDFDGISATVADAQRAGMERNMGLNYKKDIERRITMVNRKCIPTRWELVNDLSDGGLGAGELGLVVAPSGAGKTWILTAIGAEAVKQGKNVLHITLELSEDYLGIRHDAYHTGIDFREVRKNEAAVRKMMETLPGTLFVKQFPTRSQTAASIRRHLEQLELLEQIKIDLLVVDYADLLRPLVLTNNSSTYLDAGNTYEELRCIAGELQIPIWSASQTNREGHESEVVGAQSVSDSYRKIMTADFIMSLARNQNDKEEEFGRIHIVKNRFGPDGFVFPCRFDASCGRINIYEKASAEGKELMEKMKANAKEQKAKEYNLWQKFQGKKGNAN